MWIWDPKDGIDSWELVTNNVWGCEDNPGRLGKSDFMLKIAMTSIAITMEISFAMAIIESGFGA